MITNCNFKKENVPHRCISAKWKKYSENILLNGYNITMNKFSGECFAADETSEFSNYLVHAEKS